MKQFKHKRSNIIVTYERRNFYQHTVNPDMKIPVIIIEGSSEWEEIIPITDFFGDNIKDGELHYKILLLPNSTTSVSNGLMAPPDHIKVIAVFKSYYEACEYQKVFSSLRKIKDLVIGKNDEPTAYLKHALKNL